MEAFNNAILKPLAVVTGASSGIGLELARQFADNGFDLVVTAEDERIFDVGQSLQGAATVHPVRVDLAKEGGVEELWQHIKKHNRPVDAIAINAGVGVGGPFCDNDLAAELNMINLNIVSSTILSKYAVKEMLARGKGKILITASVASVMPSPFQAVYGATKAYLLSLAEAIRSELKDTEVTVTALMPGATETNFFHRANLDNTRVGVAEKDDPADVAADGFKALMQGRDHVVSHSAKTVLMEWACEFLPETAKAALHRHQLEPGGGIEDQQRH